jgi:predicted porin
MMKMKKSLIALAVLGTAGAASAQSSVTVYGRVDLSLAQQADAVKNREVRNGSGSRLGFRGVEDLGGGLKAVFQIEHRFNADTGTQSNADRYWEGKSIVGLEGGFGRVSLGREENPAYTFGQSPADPFGTDTVATNGSIVSGRIGSTRYSDSVNYRFSAAGFTVGAQITEATSNTPASSSGSTGNQFEDRPYSLGASYAVGPLTVGVGYENPSDQDDNWASGHASYNFGFLKVGGFYGSGKNAANQKHQAYLVSASAPLGGGELRASYGELKNKDLSRKLDKQAGIGYHYFLSKRTTVYADLVSERRDNMASNLEKNGFDLGIKHNF